TSVPRRIVLSSYGGFASDDSQGVLAVRAGERWRFTVRLRRPHGGANPHGFDYEAWLLERGIRATGYVRMPSRRAGDERAQVLPERLAAMAGFLAAFAYCLISGFAVPAQRTLYMVGVVAVALWFGRATSASRVLAAALFIVLALDPWAVLSPGFWLSFAAVAVIFFVA